VSKDLGRLGNHLFQSTQWTIDLINFLLSACATPSQEILKLLNYGLFQQDLDFLGQRLPATWSVTVTHILCQASTRNLKTLDLINSLISAGTKVQRFHNIILTLAKVGENVLTSVTLKIFLALLLTIWILLLSKRWLQVEVSSLLEIVLYSHCHPKIGSFMPLSRCTDIGTTLGQTTIDQTIKYWAELDNLRI
jgi:hypothetical protein